MSDRCAMTEGFTEKRGLQNSGRKNASAPRALLRRLMISMSTAAALCLVSGSESAAAECWESGSNCDDLPTPCSPCSGYIVAPDRLRSITERFRGMREVITDPGRNAVCIQRDASGRIEKVDIFYSSEAVRQ